MVSLAKAIAWATSSLTGGSRAYSQSLVKNAVYNGTFPFGADTSFLDGVFNTIVTGAPGYRGWNNAAYQQKYPSNIGGKKVINDLFNGLNTMTLPPRGDNRWYGLALCVLGSIITAQAFTDGNKRMARYSYALMIVSGGVPFLAPTDRLGSQLGDMM